MARRCTIYLDNTVEKRLSEYMQKIGINTKSAAIKNCLEWTLFSDERDNSLFEINEKLNRILYRQNINKKVLEQLFVNFGFPVNYEVAKDKLLKEVYERNNSYKGRYD